MLNFLVQTFYQSPFNHSFLFSNFPLAILFHSVILFPSKSFPHQKAKNKTQKPQAKAKGKSPSPKPKAQENPPKQKFPAPLQWVFHIQW
jgi:hypothetical protein